MTSQLLNLTFVRNFPWTKNISGNCYHAFMYVKLFCFGCADCQSGNFFVALLIRGPASPTNRESQISLVVFMVRDCSGVASVADPELWRPEIFSICVPMFTSIWFNFRPTSVWEKFPFLLYRKNTFGDLSTRQFRINPIRTFPFVSSNLRRDFTLWRIPNNGISFCGCFKWFRTAERKSSPHHFLLVVCYCY